jgi:prepilin signal peptidase PulO-like enzyme (type II secretory pathway)
MFSGFFGIFGNILSIISFLFNVSNDIFNIPLFVVGRIFQGVMVGINMTFCLVIIN